MKNLAGEHISFRSESKNPKTRSFETDAKVELLRVGQY